MNMTNALKKIAALTLVSWAGSTFAHDGHGMTGSHWHATDAWGFAAVAAVLVVAVWLSGGDK